MVRQGGRRQKVIAAAGHRKARFAVEAEDRRRKQPKDGGRSYYGAPGGAGLHGLAKVAMVQASDFWKLHDLAGGGPLEGPDVGCVLVEREMRASMMIVVKM
jgi:hypothetical protein